MLEPAGRRGSLRNVHLVFLVYSVYLVGSTAQRTKRTNRLSRRNRQDRPASLPAFRLDDVTTFGLSDAEYVEAYGFMTWPMAYRRTPVMKSTCCGQQTAFNGSE